MTTKNIIKLSILIVLSWIVILSLLILIPYFTIFQNYNSIYFPHQEKKILIPTRYADPDRNYDFVIGVPVKEKNNFEIKVYDKNKKLIKASSESELGADDPDEPKPGYYYSYKNVKDSGVMIYIKNTSNNILFSDTIAYRRLGDSWANYH